MMMLLLLGLGLFSVTLPFVACSALNLYQVSVGPNGKLAYEPEFVYAKPGDVVKFVFNPKAHTVTQSSFDKPCVSSGGFDSGFVPVASGQRDFGDFRVVVRDAAPVWIYCRQTGHCSAGMVFAINPPTSGPKSFAEFKKLAMTSNGTAKTTPAPSAKNYFAPPSTTTYAANAKESAPVEHKVSVGANGKLVFEPPNTIAAVGDTVTFVFSPKAHSVTQSSFDAPCRPLGDTSGGHEVGFDSGLTPVTAPGQATFRVKIKDTKPIWGYCRQVGHCGQGMVFSINADRDGPKSISAFQALAKKLNGTQS